MVPLKVLTLLLGVIAGMTGLGVPLLIVIVALLSYSSYIKKAHDKSEKKEGN